MCQLRSDHEATHEASSARREGREMIHASRLAIAGSVAALALVAAGCGGGGGGNSAATTTSGGGGKGGTMILLANAAPSGSADPQINYTLQEWQLLIDS